MADTKICSKCGRELPISQFYKCKTNRDGLQAQCKECTRQQQKQYYTENKEAILEQQKQYYTENKERKKQYYTENKEAILEQQKQYHQENKEKIAEYQKQYQKQYNTTLKGYCINIRSGNIKSDRKYGRIGDELPSNYPTVEDYMELLQMRDFYDGKQYHYTEMGLDRIDNSLPHTLDNVVPCTTQHNVERRKTPFDAFKAKFIAES